MKEIPKVEDQVFVLRGPDNTEEWYITVNGEVDGPWNSRCAAIAGLATEQRRAANRTIKATNVGN